MALIQDEVIVKLVEDRFRVRAEQIRNLLDLLQDDHLEYWQSVNSVLSGYADGDIVDDQNMGFKPVTKADIVTMKGREDGILAVLEASGAMDVIQKFVIRPPQLGV